MLGEACGGLGSFQFDGGSLLIASQLPLYKEPGIRSVYGVSLWNHWLPASTWFAPGCPGLLHQCFACLSRILPAKMAKSPL